MSSGADENRKRTMQSHLFEDPAAQQIEYLQVPTQNRQRDLRSHITFGEDQPPRNPYAPRPLPPLPDPSSSPTNNRILPDNYKPPTYSQINDTNTVPLRQQNPSYQSTQSYPQPIQNPNFPPPHQARFIQTPIKAAALPQYNGLVQNTELPNLSPFPDFSIKEPPISTDFQFHVKPMTSTGNRPNRKLNSTAVSEMAKMRQEFEKDSHDFQGRLAKIKPIALIQPVYQMPAQDYIPPISSRSSLSTPNLA